VIGSLNVALKEWDVVCRALAGGRQIVLLRKGGIHESAGEFELEHMRFVMFPTFLHQNLAMLKPEFHAWHEPHTAEPGRVTLSLACSVSRIIEVKSRPQIDAIDDLHLWTPPLIDMRFNYRPANPLYLLLLRAYRIEPREIDNTPDYAGCKSWVPLTSPVDVSGSRPVLDDAAFARASDQLLARLGDA
jgi:hypothetical protein